MKTLTRLERIANQLQDEARRSVEVYISAEDVAEALGIKYDPYENPYKTLTDWILDRRRLGYEPTADDVLDWAREQEPVPVGVAA
jgi:CBS domain containing-hemolysin-like protein